METILKTGYRKILMLFYKGKNFQLHLRDIARKTKLNENSATRFLNQLEKEDMLSSARDGNLRKYQIKKNNKIYLVFSMFDLEKFDKLPNKRKNALIHFLKNLEEKPIMAVLFGSTAKETFSDKSDMDLLLVVNRKIKTENSEDYAASQTGIKISAIQINYNKFLKELKMSEDKVIQSAVSSGYPIFNHLHFYEVFYGY